MAILKSCSSKEREMFDMVIRCVHVILFTQILNDHCSVTVRSYLNFEIIILVSQYPVSANSSGLLPCACFIIVNCTA